MNARYLLLVSGYAARDRYVLILGGVAVLVLLTDWATGGIGWLHRGYQAFMLLAFLGVMIFSWLHPIALP